MTGVRKSPQTEKEEALIIDAGSDSLDFDPDALIVLHAEQLARYAWTEAVERANLRRLRVGKSPRRRMPQRERKSYSVCSVRNVRNVNLEVSVRPGASTESKNRGQ